MSAIAGILTFVAGLWMIIKMFQKKGVLHGILGLIFPIYPFIWGLIHFKEEEFKKPMFLWLGGIVLSVIVAIVGGGASAPAAESFLFFLA
jgi:hypothetical protein